MSSGRYSHVFAASGLVGDDRPPECPPCFDCHLTNFACEHFTECSDANGKCQCRSGFGGDNCAVPLCDSLAVHESERHQKPSGDQYCTCSDGWMGNNCNVCRRDDVCTPLIPGELPGTCHQSSAVVRRNFMQCQVTNDGVVRNLKRSAEVTFTCDVHDRECDFQFWVAGSESFYCHMTDCSFGIEHLPAKNISTYTCDKMSCKCLPKRTLCGEDGSIDLTDWMVDKDEGPTGPMTYTCVEEPNDNHNHTCKFQEPHMNDLISLISNEDYFSLACVSGECLHATQIPGYIPPVPKGVFTPFMIGAMIVAGVGIVAGVLAGMAWFQAQTERARFVGGGMGAGDAEMEDMRRRAMMTGHTPSSLMFRDISYSIDAKAKGADAVALPAISRDAENNGGSGEASPLLADSVDSSSRFMVLEGVSASVRPGEVMAIMGGSGAGKTTLLDILAQKRKAGTVDGEILVNGAPMSHDDYRSIIGYVDQEDSLMDTLTVFETVMYSALLRLPRSLSYEAKRLRVEETLMELDIVHIANRRIGKAGSRGISGGEKRRVSIACELVTSPSILFLDEPTSGLDAYNAYNVVECLVSLARTYNRTVVFTIHQPRSNIYALFDKLVLLAKGKLVYAGPAQQQAIDHFSSLGFNCPLGFNLADYLVDLTMHAIGDSGSPPEGDTDPFADVLQDQVVSESGVSADDHPRTAARRRTSIIRLQQEERLFTPRPSSSASSSHVTGPVPIHASAGPLQSLSDDDEEAECAAGGFSTPPQASAVQSQEQTERSHGSPVSKSRRSSVGSRKRRNLFNGSAIDMSSNRASIDMKSFDGDHLMMLTTGYQRSAVAVSIKHEISAAVSAAGVPPPSPGTELPRNRSFSSLRSFRTESLHRLMRAASSTGDRPTAWTQFKILSGRTFKNLIRNPDLLQTHYVISVVVAGLCGALFWHVRNDLGGFQNRMGLFFFICALFGFGCLSSMQVFASERLIFVRERANRYYSPITYYLSKIVFDMFPLRVIPPIILGLICYHMIGLRNEHIMFLVRFLLVLICYNLTAAACCMMLSIVFRDAGLANLVATLVMLFEMLFGGLLLNKGSVPWGLSWLQYLSFFNSAMEALVVNEVNGLTLFETKFGLTIDVPGAVILQTFGFNAKGYWNDVLHLVTMFGIFIVVGFLWLQFMVRERR